MAHSQLTRANIAGLHYVFTLSSAYRRFIWLTDPDFATQNEQEAWNKVRRDAVIAHSIQKRRQSVAGLDTTFTPASDEEQDKLVAMWMEELFDKIQRFQQSRFNLAEAIFRGTSWAQIQGKRIPTKLSEDNQPRMLWVPSQLKHIDKLRFRLRRVDEPEEQKIRTVWELFNVRKHEWNPIINPDMFVRHSYDQTEDTLGYGRGLLQSMYFFWRAKEIVLQNGLNGLERWANGIIHVQVDGLRPGGTDKNNDEVVDDWLEEMEKHRSEHTLVSDKRDTITVHDWPARGAQMVLDLLSYFDKSLDRLILTSTLPTGGGDGVGSLARAEVEEGQAEATFQADRLALSETLDRSVGRLTWNRNRNVFRAMLEARGLPMGRHPCFHIAQQQFNDPTQNVNVITSALAAGIPLVKQEVYDKLGLTAPKENDEIIEPKLAPPTVPGLPFQAKLKDGSFIPIDELLKTWKLERALEGDGNGSSSQSRIGTGATG